MNVSCHKDIFSPCPTQRCCPFLKYTTTLPHPPTFPKKQKTLILPEAFRAITKTQSPAAIARAPWRYTVPAPRFPRAILSVVIDRRWRLETLWIQGSESVVGRFGSGREGRWRRRRMQGHDLGNGGHVDRHGCVARWRRACGGIWC